MTIELIREQHSGLSDREVLHVVLLEFHLFNKKIDNLMPIFDDIQTLVGTLKGSLDSIKTGVANIASGIDPNGLTAAQATSLKQQLTDLVGEAGDDAAAVNGLATPPATPAQ